ncbi:T9SS type A sorting domain-containing protein [Edaphocola aurantiacus]|uniref:T9SS type A sorting domain-containing protein n=1 Tax=Edaphocola aurantiacus TaxID=2601682 RepID=UPI001C97F8A8|nr:T9SS type A sorting domain-containing protein [Edaphocola aurantiacus]
MKFKTSIIPALIFFSIMLMQQRSYAQITPLPYYENFDTLANARWTAYRLGTNEPDDFPWYITIHNPYSAPFSMMHTCNVTGTAQANNWTVSKNAFSFVSGGKIDSIRSWITATNPPATGDTIGIYLLTGNQDPALASSVTLLHDFRGADFQTGAWIKTTDILIPPTPGQSYIAFRYKTANNCISIFLDNMQLSGNSPSGINPVSKTGIDFKVSPNPVTDNLTIRSEATIETITVYDIAGRKVHMQAYQPTINISFLSPGTYILELVDKDHKRGIQKVLKQ